MSKVKISKVVSSLPSPLTPNTLYAVRVGEGFDLYFSNSEGTVAHKINMEGAVAGVTFAELIFSCRPTDDVTNIPTGEVGRYTRGGVDVYRFTSSAEDTFQNPIEDSFFSNFDGTVLSDLIATRYD